MTGPIVYLAGPINGCNDHEATGWRNDVKPVLDELGYQHLDPMRRDYRGREHLAGVAIEIVEGDKLDIQRADIVLASCPRPSWGTAMELMYAYERQIEIVAVVPLDVVPSPWLAYHTRVKFGSLVGAARGLGRAQ